ncbi:hypothetical protein BB559_000692 [Furculomyces boomerangus]|uniref:assimilatory sulfite reductase (NADPH) n=2 Tax=Harpellales TaxID=61421 RepID=A0A2T9Z4K5_9FUNG|nr:hypothetical protein BB559_000692 [Furculomyces boomerangus]PWA01757.1 hypothetical protein BB558_002120 [Smittium angustum]PWA03094.1 hypothetical protein BB558_000737 [Smittium angustum]
MDTKSQKYNPLEAAILSAIHANSTIIVEDNSSISSALASLESVLKNSKEATQAEKKAFTDIIKVKPYGDFSRALDITLDSVRPKNDSSISVIATSDILLSLLTIVNRYSRQPFSKINSESFKPALIINVCVTSSADGQVDTSSIFAFSDLKCAILTSSNSQESYDFVKVGNIASKETGLPIIHYFDVNNSQKSTDALVFTNNEDIHKIYQSKHEEILQKIKEKEEKTQTEPENETNPESESKKNEEKETIISLTESLGAAFESVSLNTPYSSITYKGSDTAKVVFVSPVITDLNKIIAAGNSSKTNSNEYAFIEINQYRPFPKAAIIESLPKTTEKLVLLEQLKPNTNVWGPLVYDFVLLSQDSDYVSKMQSNPLIIDVQSSLSLRSVFNAESKSKIKSIVKRLLKEVSKTSSSTLIRLETLLNEEPTTGSTNVTKDIDETHTQKNVHQELEYANKIMYQQILNTAFEGRLSIVNSADPQTIWGEANKLETNPEYSFGVVLAIEQKRQQLLNSILSLLKDNKGYVGSELELLLSKWAKDYNESSNVLPHLTEKIIELLDLNTDNESENLKNIKSLKDYFRKRSNWLIGTDEWAVDIGNSGVHHVLSSGININMLIIDTSDYSDSSEDSASVIKRRISQKKDIGLYALNYGNAYVASISAYSSYTQALTALIEADSYPGPSIILAHLPKHSESTEIVSSTYLPIETMKLSKLAVDSGKWPLYRWKPNHDKEGSFVLDSQKLKAEIQSFLDRNNMLTVISNTVPKFYSGIDNTLEARKSREQARAAQRDLEKLMAGLQGPSITILYCSDASNAEEASRRINRGAKLRGLNSEMIAMDDFDSSELEYKNLVIFVVSTAGQGEFPANGRTFWKAISSASINLSNLQYAVFGLGDSHYWPLKEDKIYYNKPSKDLDKRLAELSAQRLTDIGLGDDQDEDGWETGFSAWEPRVWEALGVSSDVDSSIALDDEPPKISDEDNKIQSNYLRGNIVSELEDKSKGNVDDFTGKLLKFHGTYGQDDRDLREKRAESGLSPAYSFMIRVRLPGGRSTTDQWLNMDKLADTYGNGTIKITTRQTFQLHGVLKENLRTTINGINKGLLDTIAACGDVNRNVVSSANPLQQHLRDEVGFLARDISNALLPKSTAFHEIWVADKMVAGQAVQDFEPMYGKAYLPRKFKIAIAIPPENDVDVFAYDLGLVAILNDKEEITGYNVAIGGGMGMTHNNKKTYPRLATVIGYIDKTDVIKVCTEIVTVQRDFGDRKNRKHARMKYTVDDHGAEWYKEQVEERSGVKFEPEKPYHFDRNGDRYGWVDSTPGFKNYTMFIQNGRVADIPGYQLKSALKEIAKVHKGYFQLTCNSHLILADVPDSDVENMDQLLKKLKVHNKNYSGLRLNSMACTSLPTCGLAMAESERYLPSLVTLLDQIIDESGLRNNSIVIRMTGCPNGCARPYNAEIALVGKAPGTYNLYLGGAHNGSRLNKVYKESVNEEQIIDALTPIIKRYAIEKMDDEKFGDFVIRSGIIKKTNQGLDFHS